jgi:hypothetical protein
MRQREKNNLDHERAVAQELLQKLDITPTDKRHGNPDKGEPDYICTINGKTVGIEVTTAYYSEEEARTVAEIGEQPLKPNEIAVGEVMGDLDNEICESIQERLNEKSAKTYKGVDEVWLCINVDATVTETDSLEECVKNLEIPANVFKQIYVSYTKSDNEGGGLGLLSVYGIDTLRCLVLGAVILLLALFSAAV